MRQSETKTVRFDTRYVPSQLSKSAVDRADFSVSAWIPHPTRCQRSRQAFLSQTIMYGKIYPSMFTGSMCGSGSIVFAVFTYAIVNARPDCGSIVSLNPLALCGILGEEPENIEGAIRELCARDPKSRTTAEDGRRLIRIGNSMDYKVVNLEKYRFLDTENERAYWREKKREQRAKTSHNSLINKECLGQVRDSPRQSSKCPHAEADANAEAKALTPPVRSGFPHTIDSAIQSCAMVAVPKEFVMQCFDKANSRGGVDAKGLPITNFPSYVRIEWKYDQDRRGRQGNGNGETALTGADKVIFGREYERVDQAIKDLRASYGDHQDMDAQDREKLGKLLARRKELKNMLGVTI